MKFNIYSHIVEWCGNLLSNYEIFKKHNIKNRQMVNKHFISYVPELNKTHEKMKLEVLRISSQKDSTNGILFDVTAERKFLAYTLEDEYRESKTSGETRIPEGTYNITLRKVGGFHSKYATKYGAMHKGMLWVRDVPGFEYILIHTGNTDEHTKGCLLVGDTQQQNITKSKDGFIGASVDAYKRIYPSIAESLERGDEVEISYIDHDTV